MVRFEEGEVEILKRPGSTEASLCGEPIEPQRVHSRTNDDLRTCVATPVPPAIEILLSQLPGPPMDDPNFRLVHKSPQTFRIAEGRFTYDSAPNGPSGVQQVARSPPSGSSAEAFREDPTMPTRPHTSRLSFVLSMLAVESEHADAIALELAEMSPAEQSEAIVCSQAATISRLDQSPTPIGAPSTGLLPGHIVTSLMSHEDQVRTHVYVGPFKYYPQDFICQIARESMLDEDIEAYNNDEQEKPLFQSVMISSSNPPRVHSACSQ
ncbi:hypothetical protein PCANC_21421 [Puccinia coronata f. sp. avenae]|uniref:Uncharacterized protein n=1 Tax=Puccinia coronata f. sp. avenae TaxID=200324 RepID=A0A2N5RZN6_9BASI|nr:hypothetical protein PCANC_21421 [Puccinia coronata f. sp. avenae]